MRVVEDGTVNVRTRTDAPNVPHLVVSPEGGVPSGTTPGSDPSPPPSPRRQFTRTYIAEGVSGPSTSRPRETVGDTSTFVSGLS